MKHYTTTAGKFLLGLALLASISFKGFAGSHLNMTIGNCSASHNELQFDFLLVNDGDQAMKFNAASFRLVHDAGIIPFGSKEFSFSYLEGTTDFTAALTSRPATYNLQYNPETQIMQFTTSAGNYVAANAVELPVGQSMRVGRFALKITDGEFVPGADVNLAFFPSGNGAVVYNNGSSISTSVSQTWAIADGEIKSTNVRDTYTVANFATARRSGNPFAQSGNYAGRPYEVSTLNIQVNSVCKIAGDKPATTASASAYTAFPNPTAGKTTVAFTTDKDARYSVRVIDVLGALLMSADVSAVEGYNTLDLNLENAAQGIYFVSLQTEGSPSQTLQLVVE